MQLHTYVVTAFGLSAGTVPCHQNINRFFIGSVRSKRLSKKIRLLEMANFTKNRFYPLALPQVIFHQNGVNTEHTGGSRCGSTPTQISTPRTQFSPLTDFLWKAMLSDNRVCKSLIYSKAIGYLVDLSVKKSISFYLLESIS